ncbi:MAG: protein-L-isoaspartate O-methyltransferase [Rhodocyclaceae bacterium]|nr:protein-L-isoaspartate O-methyltransferase [Rhodocyclaceae bacterium]
MDFEKARFNMVAQQIRTWDVLDHGILDALSVVKREEFVPPAYRALAFAEVEIPLGEGASMLPPLVDARLLQAARVKKTDYVLDVGTGSGYSAALLGAMAEKVVSVEISPVLAEQARANLARAGVQNVTVEVGDAAHGWPQRGLYDVIYVGGALPQLPDDMIEQLKPGGRLIAVVGKRPAMTVMSVTCQTHGVYHTEGLFETVVAPLANAAAPKAFVF